MIPPTCL